LPLSRNGFNLPRDAQNGACRLRLKLLDELTLSACRNKAHKPIREAGDHKGRHYSGQ
jgi:hypothetical protein